MNDFTLEELCWLWNYATDHDAPPIADKLWNQIQAKALRELLPQEVRDLGHKWRSDFGKNETCP